MSSIAAPGLRPLSRALVVALCFLGESPVTEFFFSAGSIALNLEPSTFFSSLSWPFGTGGVMSALALPEPLALPPTFALPDALDTLAAADFSFGNPS